MEDIMNEEYSYHVARQTVEKMLDVVEVEMHKLEQILNVNQNITVQDLYMFLENVKTFTSDVLS
jgi:hypothetical protein